MVIKQIPTQDPENPGPSGKPSGSVAGVEDNSEFLSRATSSETPMTADVILPSRDQLTITLADRDKIYELASHNSDFTLWVGIASIFLGAILGILGSIFLEEIETLSRSAIFFLVILGIMFIACSVAAWRFWTRAKRLKDEIYE